MNTGIPGNLPVRFKKLYEDSVLPYYATEDSAGLDCTVHSIKCHHNDVISYGLGFAVEIPEGHVGLLFPRSSVYKKNHILSNSIGVIDSDYRGEVSAKFYFETIARYEIGERCCQLIIIPYPKVTVIESDTLTETKRGSGGYGSTGK